MMFAKYFEYYTIILRGPFFRGQAVDQTAGPDKSCLNSGNDQSGTCIYSARREHTV